MVGTRYRATAQGSLGEYRVVVVPLCGPDLAALPADLAPDLLGLTPEPFVAPRPVAVELLSPTHLLTRGERLPRDRPVPFEVLVKSTLDRFAGLYGDAASPVLAPEVRAVVEAEAARSQPAGLVLPGPPGPVCARVSRHYASALAGRAGFPLTSGGAQKGGRLADGAERALGL